MKNVLRLLCGWMAIALAACTGDELQQIAPLQKPVGERVISVDAYTPSDDAHTRLDFEESTEGLKLSWSENDAFTAVIGNEEVTFSYDVNSKQFTATNVAENIELTDGIVAYYPAYTGEYSTDLSEQTGALNSAKTFMGGTYHAASNSFTFAHSTAILKATFSGLPQDAVVSSIKIGAAPYTISIPYAEGMDLAEGGIYIYLPNVAKNENVVFSVSTTTGAVYTATQAVKLDEGIKVGTYYVAPITLTPAACNLPTGGEFNAAISNFLQGKELTQIKFIANSVNTDNSNPIGSSNAYMVANGNVLEIHTSAPKFVFNEDSSSMFATLMTITAIDFGNDIDTSNVTNMSFMFTGCFVLTSLDLSSFDTSSVTDMSFMFSPNPQLASLNVSSFNTSNVTNMNAMFSGCPKLTSLDLSNFNTSKVEDMAHMFSSSSALTSLDLSSFNTSNVTNMNNMFAVCNALTSLDLSNFNTSKVEDMSYMFAPCRALASLDLSNFDTSKVTDMGRMFKECSSLTSLNLSSFNTANVTNMSYMFYECHSLASLDLSSFDFGKVTSFSSMFYELGKNFEGNPIPVCVTQAGYDILYDENTNIDDNYAEYVIPTCNLPTGREFNAAISNFLQGKDLTKITFIANSVNTDKSNQIGSSNAYMVANGNVLEIHTAAPNFVFNENCLSMFYNLSSITAINFGNNIDTSQVTNMSCMFHSCLLLTTIEFGDNFDTSKVTDMSCMFMYCYKLTSLNVSNFNTSKVTDMNRVFEGCENLSSLNVSSFNTSKVETMNFMFSGCSKLSKLDLRNFNTSNVKRMYMMFAECSKLTSLDLSNFDTSKVTDMGRMFKECSSLTSLDLSSFRLSSSPDLSDVFHGLGSGLLNETKTQICVISTELAWTADLLTNSNAEYIFPTCNLPTGSVFKSAIAGFLQGKELTQIKFIVNSANVNKTAQIGSSNAYMMANGNVLEVHTAAPKFVFNAECDDMFSGLNTITAIDFGDNVDTSNVTSMYSMFYQCNALTTLNVSSFDTSKVTNMSYMFAECHNMAELDLSSFDFGEVTDFDGMFYCFAENNQDPVAVYVYVKNDNDKTLLESKSTDIDDDYAIFMVE
ncbi:MAG: BspA family leucine-rich repeat surface protein [Bacteroides sp.]|nr:BspA family leucine-rich repeat surface protein [Bacteroides sp.]